MKRLYHTHSHVFQVVLAENEEEARAISEQMLCTALLDYADSNARMQASSLGVACLDARLLSDQERAIYNNLDYQRKPEREKCA